MSGQEPTLADLIQRHQDTTQESYATIAHRAGLSKAKIGQLTARDMPHMPRADTLTKLATGLRLPAHIVQRAAMATAGIAPPDSDSNGAAQLAPIIARLRQLTDDDCETVELFINALYQRRHQDD